jgi:acyl-coenzyme A synthetase/AMP-(fatty) acid ligase
MEAILADTVVDRFQVFLAELEAILIAHPYVAVCGLWDEEGQTEVPVAYVTLSPAGREAKEGALASIARMVNSQASSYKRLRGGFICLMELPKMPSGKLLKRLLPAKRPGQQDAKL